MADIQTISLNEVPAVLQSGDLPDSQYMKAVSFLRDEGFWKKWAIGALLALAVGHILSGIIFFFAFNWDDMSAVMKFSVVGGGIAACLLAWIIAKLDSPAGQAFGIGATVLVGVMFAVLGQVYQTPAMIHTPFVFWAILTLPFALVSRNLGHWTVWLVILTVAVTTYANSGLRLANNDVAANGLNVGVGAGLIGLLIISDKVLAPRAAWARAEWFRVLLVLGAALFILFGFGESFWTNGSGLWIFALALSVGLMGYLYFLKPSLATLALACFGLFTLVAQFGFKFFNGIDLGDWFVVFIWLAILTVGLVAAFRHFVARFRMAGKTSAEDDGSDAPVTTVSAFAQHLGLDAQNIGTVLSDDAAREQPWYMSVFLAIAGVLTALLGVGFFGSLLILIIGFEDEFIFGVLGIVLFAVAVILRRMTDFPYVQHMLNTMIIIGGILTVFGFAIEVDQFDSVIGLIIILSLIVLIFIKDSILEFMAAGTMITVIGMELYHLHVPLVESVILIISTGLGIVLISRPIRQRLYKSAGTAFLMAPAVLGIALVHENRWDFVAETSRFSDDILPRIISLLVLLAAVFYLNRGKAFDAYKPPLIVLVPLLIGAAAVPLGGASALLVMITGYILGSRSLAIIGTLLQIYFLYMFYYDLSLSLLNKSIILFVSGLIFLAVWVFVRGQTLEVQKPGVAS